MMNYVNLHANGSVYVCILKLLMFTWMESQREADLHVWMDKLLISWLVLTLFHSTNGFICLSGPSKNLLSKEYFLNCRNKWYWKHVQDTYISIRTLKMTYRKSAFFRHCLYFKSRINGVFFSKFFEFLYFWSCYTGNGEAQSYIL